MRGHEETGDRGWLIAIAPGAFAFVFEALAWIAAALTGSEVPAWLGLCAYGIAIVAGVGAPIALVITRRRDAVMWAVISICVSVLGLFFGFIFYFQAGIVNCHDCFR